MPTAGSPGLAATQHRNFSNAWEFVGTEEVGEGGIFTAWRVAMLDQLLASQAQLCSDGVGAPARPGDVAVIRAGHNDIVESMTPCHRPMQGILSASALQTAISLVDVRREEVRGSGLGGWVGGCVREGGGGIL